MYDWETLLKFIPGYDPYEIAGDCWFDETEATNTIGFFENMLTHVKGEKARNKESFFLEDWQKAIVGNIYGWKNQDGTRRFREAFIFVPRKNGKSTFSAGNVLYVLFCDGEKGAEIYSAAADREQASLVFDQAKGMVLQNNELDSACKVFQKSISIDEQLSSYKAISADASTKHGYNSHLVIIDELHAQPNRELVDVLLTSTAARRQPLVIHITTAGVYDKNSICYEKYEYACKVRDGIIKDKSFLPVIYEAGKDDDWTSPETWRKANPNLNVSISENYLQRKCATAKESPAFENTFKRLHLNLWTEQDVRWIIMDKWDACIGGACPIEQLKGRQCYGGLDLSSTTDISAFALYFPETHSILSWFWIPRANAHKREKKDRVPYTQWIREGHIEPIEGDCIDYDIIRNRINEIGKQYNIHSIGVDRWQAAQIINQLKGDGFEMVPFGQGFASMSAPSKEFDRLITDKELQHYGNPVLRWMASNAAAETDAAENIKPSKKKSFERIDGIVAGIMAVGRAIAEPEKKESVYESRGIISV